MLHEWGNVCMQAGGSGEESALLYNCIPVFRYVFIDVELCSGYLVIAGR